MAEACLNEEVSGFTTRYYDANIPTNHNPVLRYNAANWARCVNLETQRVGGLKSHDYHVWLERIMPVMIRGYVDEETDRKSVV